MITKFDIDDMVYVVDSTDEGMVNAIQIKMGLKGPKVEYRVDFGGSYGMEWINEDDLSDIPTFKEPVDLNDAIYAQKERHE